VDLVATPKDQWRGCGSLTDAEPGGYSGRGTAAIDEFEHAFDGARALRTARSRLVMPKSCLPSWRRVKPMCKIGIDQARGSSAGHLPRIHVPYRVAPRGEIPTHTPRAPRDRLTKPHTLRGVV